MASSKPRVCLITFRNFREEDRRAQKEVRSLLEHGYEVDVVYSARRFGVPSEDLEHADLRHVPIPIRANYALRGRLGSLLNLFFYQSRALPRFLIEALRSRADLYLCHNVQGLLVGGLAARLRGVPFFYDCRELWREIRVSGSGASLARVWGLVERLFTRQARGVFAVCDFHADYLSDAYGIPRPTVVRNCPPRWDPPSATVLRQRYGIPDDHLVAIHTGGLFEGVGIDRLIEAADHLDPGITVVILGFFLRDHFKEATLEAITRRPNVVFAEPVSQGEMPAYLAGADVGIVLYLANYKANQSLPNKLFEYMMSGLAVVTNGYRDTRAVVETSGAGFALDPVTPGTLADAINRLRREPTLLTDLKRRARRAALTTYVWDREAERLLADLEKGIGAPRSPDAGTPPTHP